MLATRLPPLLYSCFLILAACSSGGGSNPSSELGIGGTDGIPDLSGLPISGTAHYAGFLTLTLPTAAGTAEHNSALSLSVDFGASSAAITGQADDFIAPDNSALTGRIFITDGSIDRSSDGAATIGAGLSGTLRSADFRNLVVTGQLDGTFIGDRGEAMSGRAAGSVISNIGVTPLAGRFSASSP